MIIEWLFQIFPDIWSEMFSHSLWFCVPSNNHLLKIIKWTFGHCPAFLMDETPGSKCPVHGLLTRSKLVPSVRRSSYGLMPMISLCVSPNLFQIHSVPTVALVSVSSSWVRAVEECMHKINRRSSRHSPCFWCRYRLNWQWFRCCIFL